MYGLENIAISLNDALTKPVLERLELKGGPASDSVILGFNQNADGSYTPDYPRLFPTLVENTDKYTLTAYATDTKGNATQKSIQFAYYPKNLVTLGKTQNAGCGEGAENQRQHSAGRHAYRAVEGGTMAPWFRVYKLPTSRSGLTLIMRSTYWVLSFSRAKPKTSR